MYPKLFTLEVSEILQGDEWTTVVCLHDSGWDGITYMGVGGFVMVICWQAAWWGESVWLCDRR